MPASEFLKRSLSGAAYVGTLVAALYAGKPWFPLFMALVAAGCWWEFLGLLPRKIDFNLRLIFWTPGVAFALTFLFPQGQALALWPILALALLGWGIGLLKPAQKGLWIDAAAGLLLSTLPFWLLSRLAYLPQGGFKPVLLLFLLIWTNDTFAYLGGKAFGKRKLAPAISPGKSIEGLVVGLSSGMLVAGLLGHYWLGASPWKWPAFSAIFLPLAVAGDLFESFLKRRVGRKDSGRFLPGHGGFLDRFDSFLLSVPATWPLLWTLGLI